MQSRADLTIDNSTERALHAIVRRVLRMQTQRSRLERTILKEAKRLKNGEPEAVSPDSIAEFIVEKLKRQLPSRMNGNPLANVASAAFSGLPTIATGYSTRKTQ